MILIAMLAAALAAATGIVVALRLAPREGSHARAFVLVAIGAGAGLGLGLTSVTHFFGLALAAGWSPWPLILLRDGLVLAVLAWLLWRVLPAAPAAVRSATASPRSTPYRFVLWIGAAATLLLAFWLVSVGLARLPHGMWDAWGMWNYKARFFHAGQAWWAYPLVEDFAPSHPDYPLLLPLTIARLWDCLGDNSTWVPRLIASTFLLLLALTLVGLLTQRRSASMAAAALAIVLASPLLLELAPWQYADLPLAFYYLAAIGLLSMALRTANHWRGLLLAGLLAGCAAWTKNEGLLFVLAAGIALLAMRAARGNLSLAARELGFFLLGASPLLLTVLAAKLQLTGQSDLAAASTAQGLWDRLGDPQRYWTILQLIGTVLTAKLDNRILILLAAYALVARWPGREALAGLVVPALTLLLTAVGYFMVYVLTPNDLDWHLQTSLPRLILHLWPSAIFLALAWLRTPEELLTSAALKPR